jgi:HK97 family phage major capsid protein
MKKPTPARVPVELNDTRAQAYSFARAIAPNGCPSSSSMAGFEREIGQELEKKLPQEYKRRGGILLPTVTTRAGLDSATATKGNELKFTQPGDFIDLLRARMKTRALGARILGGLTGPVSFIKQTGAASGSWLAENPGADVADSNLLLALVTLAIKTYQASTSFSRQLLVSAISGSVDAEQMVRDDLALVHALALDSAGIQGSGAANQPRGVLNTAGIGAEVGGANGAAATYANMVNMETTVAVANADVDSMAYLTTPGQRGKLKQIAQLANTANIPVWHDGEVNGYRAEVSTQVPSNLTKGTAVGICSAIIFGDWSQLVYGEWGVLELITDPFRLKKQGMIEVTSFQMADVGVRIPAAFRHAGRALIGA